MRGGSHSKRKLKEVMILASQFGEVWVSDVAVCYIFLSVEETNPVAEKASLGNVSMNETIMNNKMPTQEASFRFQED